MAPRKSRAEKTVLSRQDIAQKRKALQAKRRKGGTQAVRTGGAGRRALFGTFVLTSSVLSLLAVATFDPQDRVGPGFENAIGPVGHALAEALRGFIGVCAYVLPLAGIYAAYIMFAGDRERRRGSQVLSLGLLLVSGAVLAQLLFQGEPGWAHAPGGMVGRELGGLLAGLFSTVGTVVLVSAVCVAALIVGTEYAFLRLCNVVWGWVQVWGARAQAWLERFIDAQKVAWELRREERERERLEEAAFLAQLEADEEELEDAERELLEAEAAAEEAAREARIAEERERLAAQRDAQAAQARRRPAANARTALPEPRAEAAKGPHIALPPGREIVDAEADDVAGDEPAWVGSLEQLSGRAAATAAPSAARKGKKAQAPVIAAPGGEEDEEQPVPAPLALAPQRAAPPEAAARTPLIVAPKEPPKPTAKPAAPNTAIRLAVCTPNRANTAITVKMRTAHTTTVWNIGTIVASIRGERVAARRTQLPSNDDSHQPITNISNAVARLTTPSAKRGITVCKPIRYSSIPSPVY